MEDKTDDSVGINVIQALSSSAATASTSNHPVKDNQGSPLDSNSVSYSEGDGLDTVPPPPPPLGIETQFDMLHMSSPDHLTPNKSHDCGKNENEYHSNQNSSRKTIFQKLHNLGLSTSSSQSRRNKLNEKQTNANSDEYITPNNKEQVHIKDELPSEYSTSHFATLRRICSPTQNRNTDSLSRGSIDENYKNSSFIKGISIEERLHEHSRSRRPSRKSSSSNTRKSLTNYSDNDFTGYDYDGYGPSKKGKSGSMSSLSSRGSTLSWFRKRSRKPIFEKGIYQYKFPFQVSVSLP